ncbi:MAG: hypothetical protein QOF35_1552 [Actinomycetota bacterium]|nr:hypothetical protein [Actinomycetota bacterium]
MRDRRATCPSRDKAAKAGMTALPPGRRAGGGEAVAGMAAIARQSAIARMAVLAVLAVLVTMTACGGTLATPPRQTQQAGFPVTITRIGGIAGLHDVLTVTGDGRVSVTRSGQGLRRCQLTEAAVKPLTTAASQVPFSRIPPARTQPSFPDDLVTTLSSPAGGPVNLEDPQAKSGQVFLDLLNVLTGDPAAAARTCRPL